MEIAEGQYVLVEDLQVPYLMCLLQCSSSLNQYILYINIVIYVGTSVNSVTKD